MLKSEIRKAYLLNKYVIITPSRAKRPRDIKEETLIKRTGRCPFCPENIVDENIIDKINHHKKWQVLALKNIYPAVTLDNNRAYGTQEVIIETPSHSRELAELSEEHIERVLRMYSRRTKALMRVKKINYILCFKNQGSKAGASIVHAHSQVFATNLTPPDVLRESKAAQAYRIKHKICPYCDIIKKEMLGKRKVYEDKFVAAFTPYASEFHYEVWIFTKRHLDNITLLSNEEFRSLARAYKKILLKLHQLNLAFNMFIHQVVTDQDQHFYLKIQPRDSIWAGIELGSGLVINSVPPEEAARFFRE
jgi:UDPglucose--hexose-1-phosphate uridylyltransferase